MHMEEAAALRYLALRSSAPVAFLSSIVLKAFITSFIIIRGILNVTPSGVLLATHSTNFVGITWIASILWKVICDLLSYINKMFI